MSSSKHPSREASRELVFTQEDFDRFARLSGDDNPIHVDPEFAKKTRWGRTLCHGMLLYATVDSLIAREFPGVEILSQELKFPGPTFTGEVMTVLVEVSGDEIVSRITRPNGEASLEGTTRVRWP